MIIQKSVMAGTLESSDIMITLKPHGADGIEIELDSTVEKQFGKEIRTVIRDTLAELGVSGVRVVAVDKGALNCTVRARVKTAVCRACEDFSYPWGGGDAR